MIDMIGRDSLFPTQKEEANEHTKLDQLIGDLKKSDLQVINIDNQPIILNYQRLVSELVSYHQQVWQDASTSFFVLLKEAITVLAQLLISDMTAKNLYEISEINTLYKFKNNLIIPLLQSGHIEMTNPDKPRSSKQKYRLTKKGRNLLFNELI